MKYTSLILILIFPSLAGAQSYQEAIEKDFTVYVDHIIAKEFDQAMEYTYEKFFELVPRDKMVQMMEATFNSPEIEYELSRAQVTSVEEPVRIGPEYFALMKYLSIIRMKFLTGEGEETQEEFEQRMTMTRLSLEELFGKENVSYEAETGFWKLYAEKTVCAVSKDGATDWHFVVMEKEQLPFLKNILPSQVLEQLQ